MAVIAWDQIAPKTPSLTHRHIFRLKASPELMARSPALWDSGHADTKSERVRGAG